MAKDNEDISKLNKDAIEFSKYRGRLKELYGNDRLVKNKGGESTKLTKLSDIYTKDAYKLIKQALENPKDASKISEAAYYASNPYASIIDYYKTFFYIRYIIVPHKVKDKENTKMINDNGGETGQKDEEYAKIYNRMVSSVEGINFENLLPSIIEQTLIKGRCGIVTEKDTSSETIFTTFLPDGYFKSVGKTQFGTNIIAFDCKYFDDLNTSLSGSYGNPQAVEKSSFEDVIKTMPKILQEAYQQYEEDGIRWHILDSKTATEFKFNDLGIPAKLGAYPASADYNKYKDIELDIASQSLDHVLTQQIATNSDGDLIMDVDEAIEVTKELKNSLSSIPNLKVATTFGKTEVHNLGQNRDKQVNIVDNAYNAIYNSAGVDYHVFISDKDLEVSLKRDKAFLWTFLQVVMLFYNIAINNIINFNPYQCKISLLPISVQMEEEDAKRYIDYAGAGIGRLQAICATGIKQSDLKDMSDVEEFLNLDEILKPLQSMYTTSNIGDSKKVDKKEESNDFE